MKRKTWDNLGCLARDLTFYVKNSKTMLRKLHGLAKFVSKRMKQGQEFTISQLAQCAVIKNVVDKASCNAVRALRVSAIRLKSSLIFKLLNHGNK